MAVEAPSLGLGWLLFVGSSVHVAATGWLFTFREVRAHVNSHRTRYVVAPGALIVIGSCVAGLCSPRHLDVLLLGFFGWQFFHYQKQNLGLVALSAASHRVAGLARLERRAIMATGWIGIAGLLLHPGVLQLSDPRLGWHPTTPFAVAAAGFGICAAAGVLVLLRRPALDRPGSFCAVYLMALCFPLPIFVFSSPYAAVGGMTIAHGLQYLILVGMVAVGPRNHGSPLTRLSCYLSAALLSGAALNRASHLHTGGAVARVVYGAYLGIVMTHFVVDAGIWRLRDPFPRQFMTARLPFLLRPRQASATDASPIGVA